MSALTSSASYIVGGLIPLTPYLLAPIIETALRIPIVFTLAALLIFGYVKARFTGVRPIRSALQTALVGGQPELRMARSNLYRYELDFVDMMAFLKRS